MAHGRVPSYYGGLRAVTDLRKVNECVQRDGYPLPDVQECLDQLAGKVVQPDRSQLGVLATTLGRRVTGLHRVQYTHTWLAEMDGATDGV